MTMLSHLVPCRCSWHRHLDSPLLIQMWCNISTTLIDVETMQLVRAYLKTMIYRVLTVLEICLRALKTLESKWFQNLLKSPGISLHTHTYMFLTQKQWHTIVILRFKFYSVSASRLKEVYVENFVTMVVSGPIANQKWLDILCRHLYLICGVLILI